MTLRERIEERRKAQGSPTREVRGRAISEKEYIKNVGKKNFEREMETLRKNPGINVI